MCCFPEISNEVSNAESKRQPIDLKLQFARSLNGETYISNQYCRYPFHICRAQYVDTNPPGLATIYLQSCAGGIFEGDRLLCEFHTLPESQAHITTPASTIVHSMNHGTAELCVTIKAEKGCYTEYLPDPLILFPESQLRSKLVVRMHATAIICLTDAFLVHDPMNCGNKFGEYQNETRIEDLQGKLLCLDRYRITGEQFSNNYIGVMGDYAVHGTAMFLGPVNQTSSLPETLKEVLDTNCAVYTGVSVLPNDCGIWIRLLSKDTFELRSTITKLWEVWRFNFAGALPQTRKK